MMRTTRLATARIRTPLRLGRSRPLRVVLATMLGCAAAGVLAVGPAVADTSVSTPVGSNPRGMVFDPVNGDVYVGNYGGNSVSVIDGSTNTVVDTIDLGNHKPYALAFDPINGDIYVSTPPYNDGGVAVIDGNNDTTANQVIAYVTTNILGIVDVNGIPTTAQEGDGYPLGLAFDPVNGDIYVTESISTKVQSDGTALHADGTTVTVIDGNNDATANTVVGTVKVGNRPVAVAFDAADGGMYVANADDDTVSVIDGTKDATANTVTSTVGPLGLYAGLGVALTDLAFDSADGNIYVTTQGGTNSNLSGYVSVIHGTTIVEPNVFPSNSVYNSNARLFGVAFDPVNGDVYVVDNGTVDVMDGSNSNFGTVNTFIGSFGVGVEPLQAVFDSTNDSIYVDNLSGTVSVSRPQSIAFTSPAPTNALVSNTSTVAASGASGNPVVFASATPPVCTVSGTTVSYVAAGTCQLYADQPGTADYLASPWVTQTFTVTQGSLSPQSVTFTSTPPTNANAGDDAGSYTPTATGGASGKPVVFSTDAADNSVCFFYQGAVYFGGIQTEAGGVCVIDANQAGNAYYGAAPLATQSFTVARAAQIGFTAPGTGQVGASAVLTATATLGQTVEPVTFSVDPSTATGVCAVSGVNGSTLSYVGVGSCVVDANQASVGGLAAAAQVQGTVSVTPASAPQVITFTPPGGGTYGDSATLSATGGASGNPVTFSLDSTSGAGVCVLSGTDGTQLSYTAVGSCVVDADQAAGGNYAAAPTVQRTFPVAAAPLTVTASSPTAVYGAGVPAVTASYSGFVNGDSASTLSPAPTCSTTATAGAGAGSYVTSCSGAVDPNYTIGYVTGTLTIARADQTIQIMTPAPASASYGASFTVAATSSSGLTVGYASGGACSNSGATFTMTSGTGTCTVSFSQPGDANDNGAPSRTESVTAQPAGTSTALGTSANPAVQGQPVTFTATVSVTPPGAPIPGGTVDFYDGATRIGSATLSNGQASFATSGLSVGAHAITASYEGTDNYMGSFSSTSTQYVDINLSSFSTLSNINLKGVFLVNANLSGQNLSNSNLSGANLSGADLSNANLYGTNLSYANLTGADLSGANLSYANLKGATGLTAGQLTGVTWNKTGCPDGTLSNKDGGTCLHHLTP